MTAETDETRELASSVLMFFGSELNRLRRKAGWSQEKTAKAARSTQSMISKVESARLVPSEILAKELDRAFGTTLSHEVSR
jgi:ribosome-binding protein aMBF1 (putative translation factor)